MDRYLTLLEKSIAQLQLEPKRLGVKDLSGISRGLYGYHIRHSKGRAISDTGVVEKPRHLIIFRVKGDTLIVVRVLHDSMELGRHLP